MNYFKTDTILTLDLTHTPPALTRSIGSLTIINIKYGQKMIIKKSPNGLFRIFGRMGEYPVKICSNLVKNVEGGYCFHRFH